MRIPERWATPPAVAAFALRELARESGMVFLGATVVLSAMSLLTWAAGEFHPLDLAMLLMWVLSASVVVRRALPVRFIPWLWGTLAALTSGVLWIEMATHEDIGAVGYILVVSAVFPPLALFWRPVMAAGAVILIETGVVAAVRSDSAMWTPIEPSDALLQVLAALLGGSVALYFRRRSLMATVDATTQLETRALTDGMTGVLNRQGAEELGRRLVERARGPVFALFMDINGLKRVNDTYGHDVGDELIRSVALAARNVMRANDLIGRWGGDEFVVIGVGESPDPQVIETRMLKVLAQLGITRQAAQGVSVGGASGELDFDDLIAAADEDMYDRRSAARGTRPAQ